MIVDANLLAELQAKVLLASRQETKSENSSKAQWPVWQQDLWRKMIKESMLFNRLPRLAFFSTPLRKNSWSDVYAQTVSPKDISEDGSQRDDAVDAIKYGMSTVKISRYMTVIDESTPFP